MDLKGWQNKSVSFVPDGFDAFRTAYGATFPDGDLADGQAMAGHDSVLAAARAVAAFQSAQPLNSSRLLPSGRDLKNQLLIMQDIGGPQFAGGQLSFQSRGPDSGNPLGKPIPVLEIPTGKPDAETYVTSPSN
jgi:hypothetical protein